MAAHPAIDPRIQGLPSTTFFGKRLTRRQIADVQEMVQACSGLSRTELAKTVCEHLRWKAGSGASRVRLATRFLEQLATHGIVSLPAKQPRPRGQWHSFSGGGLRYRFARLENGRASHFFLLGLQRSSGRRETRG